MSDILANINEISIIEDIFNHLTVSELLKLTEVSRAYNDFITKNYRLMSRICLTIKNSDFEEFTREYQHFKISKGFLFSNRQDGIEEDKTIKKQKSFKLLTKYSGRAKSITIEESNSLDVSCDQNVFIFEKLESLKVTTVTDETLTLFKVMPNLQKLSISKVMTKLYKITDTLRTLDKLRILEIGNDYSLLFCQHIMQLIKREKFQLKLTKLIVRGYIEPENFKEFLLTQARNLKEVEFHYPSHAEILNLIFRNFKLTKLVVNKIVDPWNLVLKRNEYIKDIKVKPAYYDKIILSAVPRLVKTN